jgi:hypothetical protein
MSSHVYYYHFTTCTKPGKWASCVFFTITLPVQSQDNERSCVLLPLHYLYNAKKISGHVCCYHCTTCTKPGKWAVMCIITITLPVQSQDNERHVYCYHYTTCTKPGKWPVMCIFYHYTTCTKPGKWALMCIVTITLPVQSQDNGRSCVLLRLHYLYKARYMSGHVYCYHYTTCTKPGKWAVMCIVTITLPVQSQEIERSCVFLPLHYLYKDWTMSGHVYCYHYTTCTKLGQWASCVLLPLHYLYKARKVSDHVYCYHYTTCTKPGKWAVMCIVTITMHVQSKENERSCVLLPLHYLYKAR